MQIVYILFVIIFYDKNLLYYHLVGPIFGKAIFLQKILKKTDTKAHRQLQCFHKINMVCIILLEMFGSGQPIGGRQGTQAISNQIL